MTLQETKNQINEIIGVVDSYINEISTLETEISKINENVNSVGNLMSECVESVVISNYNGQVQNDITSTVNGCITTINSTISTIKKDANRKIKELINAYNIVNDKLEEDQRERFLSFDEFSI